MKSSFGLTESYGCRSHPDAQSDASSEALGHRQSPRSRPVSRHSRASAPASDVCRHVPSGHGPPDGTSRNMSPARRRSFIRGCDWVKAQRRVDVLNALTTTFNVDVVFFD
jgi:hypothetical protein